MLSIGFMLLILMMSLTVVFDRDREAAEIEEFLENRTSCDALALVTEATFASGENTAMVKEISKNITIYGEAGQIVVGEVFCLTIADLTNGTDNNFTLTEGTVEILALEEEVRLRNV